MVQGVFFDAAGVLYEREQSPDTCALGLLRAGRYPTCLPAEVEEQLAALKSQASCGRVSAETYWDAFLTRHGVATADARDCLRQQILACANRVHPMPGARAALAALKARGLVVGVISDTIYPLATKMAWLARVGVADLLDVVACSTVVGAHKPDPAIYLHALHQAGLGPAAAAFVGHDAGELAGARRVGMTTIAAHHAPGTPADDVVDDLAGLLALPVLGGLAGRAR